MAKMVSRVFPLSTSMFPVDDPMKTLTPAISSGVMPVSGSPSFTRRHISSAFELVAPIWKAIFPLALLFAVSILSFRAVAVVVGGLVFGMSMEYVTPPARAAFDSLAISALWVSPGSRK